MTDRYEKIRKALEMGPTPGPWYLDGEGIRALVRDANGVIVTVRHRMPGHKNETNMRLIAACDPDTIRELLAERDQLAAALEAAREDAERPLRPSGLSSGPRFVVHVPGPDQQPAAVDGAMVRVPRGAAEVAAAVAVEWAEMFAGIPGLEKYERYHYGPAVEQMRDDMAAALAQQQGGRADG